MSDATSLFARLRALIDAADIFDDVPPVKSEGSSIFCHTCIPSSNIALPQHERDLIRCGGAGFDECSSWISAVGEGIERFCAAKHSLSASFCRSSYEDLSRPLVAVHPSRWMTHSPSTYASSDFPLTPFSERSPCKWYAGRSLSTGSFSLLPGPFVAFPYRRRRDEPKYSASTSTGLAFGGSEEDALVTAALEVIERDAVALAWNWGIPVKRIASDSPTLISTTKRTGLAPNFDVHAYEITSDVNLPVAMAFVTSRDRRFLSTGSSCRTTLSQALQKAILEAVQGISYVTALERIYRTRATPNGPVGESFSVNSFRDSAVFYTLHPELLDTHREKHGGEFFAIEAVHRTWSEPECRASLKSVLGAIHSRGYEAYAVDMTQPNIAEIGANVCRVVIPGLYGLEGSYRFRQDDPRRADIVSAHKRQPHSPNPLPHPLP